MPGPAQRLSFRTKIVPRVPNAQVPGVVAEAMQDPNYVRHVLLPENETTTSVVLIFRK